MMHYYSYGLGGFGEFGMVILWIIIIFGIIWLVRGSSHYGHHGHFEHRNSAHDILSERYAKGEINKEEFEQKKKDLEK